MRQMRGTPTMVVHWGLVGQAHVVCTTHHLVLHGTAMHTKGRRSEGDPHTTVVGVVIMAKRVGVPMHMGVSMHMGMHLVGAMLRTRDTVMMMMMRRRVGNQCTSVHVMIRAMVWVGCTKAGGNRHVVLMFVVMFVVIFITISSITRANMRVCMCAMRVCMGPATRMRVIAPTTTMMGMTMGATMGATGTWHSNQGRPHHRGILWVWA